MLLRVQMEDLRSQHAKGRRRLPCHRWDCPKALSRWSKTLHHHEYHQRLPIKQSWHLVCHQYRQRRPSKRSQHLCCQQRYRRPLGKWSQHVRCQQHYRRPLGKRSQHLRLSPVLSATAKASGAGTYPDIGIANDLQSSRTNARSAIRVVNNLPTSGSEVASPTGFEKPARIASTATHVGNSPTLAHTVIQDTSRAAPHEIAAPDAQRQSAPSVIAKPQETVSNPSPALSSVPTANPPGNTHQPAPTKDVRTLAGPASSPPQSPLPAALRQPTASSSDGSPAPRDTVTTQSNAADMEPAHRKADSTLKRAPEGNIETAPAPSANHVPDATSSSPNATDPVQRNTSAPAESARPISIQPGTGAPPTNPITGSNTATKTETSFPQVDIPALAAHVTAKAKAGDKHFDIRLDPPDLGQVEVHLSVSSDGRAQAHVTADKPQTLDALQRDQATLHRALKDAGLELANNSLNFSLKGQERGDGGAQRYAMRPQQLQMPDTPDAISPFPLTPIRATDGRLDIRV